MGLERLVLGGGWLVVGGGWWWLVAVGGSCRLVVGSWWRLVVGGRRLAVVGSGWQLAVGGPWGLSLRLAAVGVGSWGLVVGGGWWRLAMVGSGWWLAVGGPRGLCLRAVLSPKKKMGCSVLGRGAEPLVRMQFLEHPPTLNFGANHLKKWIQHPQKPPIPFLSPHNPHHGGGFLGGGQRVRAQLEQS